ncbi:MAG: hypothetical protein MR361_09720 [Clostridiales bacterium]|nr:hypothetical protein [Clostridiales bacterium]
MEKKYEGIKLILILLGSIILGYVLMIGVYTIPTEKIYSNVMTATDFFNEDTPYPQVINGYMDSQLDNWTDSLMLLIAATKTNETIAYQAMNNAHIVLEDQDCFETLENINENNSLKQVYSSGYGRYWHGYLVILKPLLYIFTYKQLIYINMMMQQLILVSVCCIYILKKQGKMIVPFLGVYFFFNPISLALSIQFSGIWYITMISLFVLAIKEWSGRKKIIIFILIGILTSYIDLLTYPLVTLGIPVLYAVLNKTDVEKFVKKLFVLIRYSIAWGIGYAGMWSGKWIIGTLITKKNLIENAYQQAAYRSGYVASDIKFSYIDILKGILRASNKLVICFVLAVGGLIFLYELIKKQKIYIKDNIVILLAILGYPFLWYGVFANHSFWHTFFTYRTFGIALYVVLYALVGNWANLQKHKYLSK